MCREQRNYSGAAPHLDYQLVRHCVNGKGNFVTPSEEVIKQQAL